MDLQTVTCIIIEEVRKSLQNRESQSFDVFLEELYERYEVLLHSIDNNCKIKSKLLEEADYTKQRIFDSINDYYSGNLMGALTEIQRLHWHFEDSLNVRTIKKGDIWYRGRVMKRGRKLYTRKEMFHIPDNQRENVSNQRFSVNGYPCLYLGKSVWDCWEELDEPYFDDICFSAFKAIEDIKLADLILPTTEENLNIGESINYFNLLSNLPLIISCSIKTLNESASFKHEYIIPQLLMVDLINLKKYDGYLFSSTKQNLALEWDKRYLHNIVLPVSTQFDENGLCMNLKKKFLITEPVCYKYEYLKANVSNLSFITERDIDNLFSGHETEEETDSYPNSLFGQIEKVLKTKSFSQL